MADWVCPIYGCTWKVGAPPVPPVHRTLPSGEPLARDPSCPVHRIEMTYTPNPLEDAVRPPSASQVAKNPGFTLSGELLTSYSNKEQPDVRAEVSTAMGISDKGHPTHGSNFSSPQTLKQIIDNLFVTVQGGKVDAAAQGVINAYGYDPRTMMMAPK